MSVPVSAYVPDFRPTHVVPRDGLPAWEAPDPGLPTAPLDAFLPVRLEERSGDWGRIRCSNGWTAWVDARLLVGVPDDPPAAGRPLTRTADPRPLIARAEDALGRYRRAAEELGAGRLDGEAFRLRTRGLRVGMVVDGESVWLYDAEHERWVYCDGAGLSTYAAGAAPSATAAPPAAPASAPPEEEAGDGSSDGSADGGREPVGAVPAGHDPTRVAPRGDAAETGPAGEPEPTGPPPPTRVVERPPGTPEAPPARGVEQPPAEVVERPPTRVVERPPETVEAPPTQVVEQPSEAPDAPPTQVVQQPPETPDAPPTRAVRPSSGAGDPPPTRVVVRPPTGEG
ncbi:hypothetical protein ACFUJ0_27630 [Streptomyces sp. NPDC057242]|uniref:hypothetical protein n=1 Tax=unclassified Streptomyces TaxID=2593676 RepID=UPI003630AE9D